MFNSFMDFVCSNEKLLMCRPLRGKGSKNESQVERMKELQLQ
jgi:hypothetical protein